VWKRAANQPALSHVVAFRSVCVCFCCVTSQKKENTQVQHAALDPDMSEVCTCTTMHHTRAVELQMGRVLTANSVHQRTAWL